MSNFEKGLELRVSSALWPVLQPVTAQIVLFLIEASVNGAHMCLPDIIPHLNFAVLFWIQY